MTMLSSGTSEAQYMESCSVYLYLRVTVGITELEDRDWHSIYLDRAPRAAEGHWRHHPLGARHPRAPLSSTWEGAATRFSSAWRSLLGLGLGAVTHSSGTFDKDHLNAGHANTYRATVKNNWCT